VKARAKAARENRDVNLEMMKASEEERRKTIVEQIQTTGAVLGAGMREFISDRTKIASAVSKYKNSFYFYKWECTRKMGFLPRYHFLGHKRKSMEKRYRPILVFFRLAASLCSRLAGTRPSGEPPWWPNTWTLGWANRPWSARLPA
jgi:hypothetical protein